MQASGITMLPPFQDGLGVCGMNTNPLTLIVNTPNILYYTTKWEYIRQGGLILGGGVQRLIRL